MPQSTLLSNPFLNVSPLGRSAARASWCAPILAVCLSYFLFRFRSSGDQADAHSVAIVIGIFILLLVLLGFIFAIFAFTALVRCGDYRPLIPATIGFLLNGGLLSLMVAVFYAVGVAGAASDEHDLAQSPQVISDTSVVGASWTEPSGLYENQEFAFSITFPEQWEVMHKSAQHQLLVIGRSPLTDENDDFRENISIVSERRPHNWNLEQYALRNLEDMRANTEGFTLESRGIDEINGVPSYWIEYRVAIDGADFHMVAYFLAGEEYAYVITCGARLGTLEAFGPKFGEIVWTFELLE